jgi:D-aminopeptidase
MTLDKAISDLPYLFPGPGGACAVVKSGKVLVRHSWGFANAERRIAFTSKTLLRMCSITKQFTCGLALDLFKNIDELDGDVRARLPLLAGAAPSALHLCHNQSGLRDYWAVAMLHGSPVEAPFGDIEAARLIQGTRSLQFTPGSRYAYCNQNFRILSDILEARTGQGFGDLLRARIFEKAGMDSAMLAADTQALPDGSLGYEGTQASGFREAVNRIVWTGDAGMAASLDDMIAWEVFIDRTREDANGLYNQLSAPPHFSNGASAAYGFGLGRAERLGRRITAHGGALRGWRSHRLHVAEERLSIVVMFNHMSDAQAAATGVLSACLGEEPALPQTRGTPDWLGAYLDAETGLSVRLEAAGPGKIRVRYANPAEWLDVQEDGSAQSESVWVGRHQGEVWMDRPAANQKARLEPCAAPGPTDEPMDIAGKYWCGELEAALSVVDSGGVLYGGFSGFLGQGRMELLEPIGGNLWALPCPRALDHTPPGDWTLKFHGSGSRADGVQVGCLIARGLAYHRQ